MKQHQRALVDVEVAQMRRIGGEQIAQRAEALDQRLGVDELDRSGRRQLFAASPLRESETFQDALGPVAADLDAARAISEARVASHWRRALAGALKDERFYTQATQTAIWVTSCFRLGGGNALSESSPLQQPGVVPIQDLLGGPGEPRRTKEIANEQGSKGSVPRRDLLFGGAIVVAAAGVLDETVQAQPMTMSFQKTDTAVVFIDPQNDVLSPKGANWGAVGASVTENKTVENMERIFKAAKAGGYEVFISPHYFYPTDSGWAFNGPLETEEFRTHTFARKGPLTLEGFANSGADWLDRFKPYIEDGKTIIVSPHKVWGPQTNDLVLQLAKRRISKIILGGMLANICVEAHLREFLERGFEVAVVKDATAGPRHPEWGDGYQAAMINYRFLAHAVLSTDETVDRMR